MIRTAAAVAIFAAVYLVMAFGRFPGSRIDRAGAAFLGGALMVAAGVLPLDDAYAAIDWDTIALLLGMMLLAANLRLAGFFDAVTVWVVRRAGHPLLLLGGVVLVSGVLSAVLVNDTICLVLTPLVLDIVRQMRRDAAPYLIAVALAANIGSTATITGNPQNMIVAGIAHIPYGDFAAALAPVAAVGLALTMVLVALCWPGEFLTRAWLNATATAARIHAGLLGVTLAVLAGVVAAFLLGVRPALAAMVGGAILLAGRRLKVARMYQHVDWTLLLMFCGLFVVVAGFERSVISPAMVARLQLGSIWILGAATAVLSNVVSNVPAVLVLKPFVAADQQRAWIVIAMAATLAGNFSIMGSVANLIVVQAARRHGVAIGFWAYFRVGAPLTVLSILAGLAMV